MKLGHVVEGEARKWYDLLYTTKGIADAYGMLVPMERRDKSKEDRAGELVAFREYRQNCSRTAMPRHFPRQHQLTASEIRGMYFQANLGRASTPDYWRLKVLHALFSVIYLKLSSV